MTGAIRTRGSVGRDGGEEFLAVIPEATRDEAAAVAEHLRACLAQAPVATGTGPLAVTASLGLAWASASDPPNADVLLATATALYRAKKRGAQPRRGRLTGPRTKVLDRRDGVGTMAPSIRIPA